MAVAKKTIKKTTSAKKPVVAKTVVKKVVVKVARPVVKTEKVEATVSSAKGTLKISILDASGKATGTLSLPEAIFGVKVNKALIAQAVRVYLANQRRGSASTKTRGEVAGSTRKIYRQKGTGRARHGGIRAPIFVKGGIAHGPRVHDHNLSLPVAMKRKALFSALSVKTQASQITIVTGFEKLDAKTKAMVKALRAVGMEDRDRVLVIVPEHNEKIYRSARNIAGVEIIAAANLHTYGVMAAKRLIFMKDAITKLEGVFI